MDYKIQWEKLDWFWNALSEYKKDESKKDSVVESFAAMDISDRIWCHQNIKGKSCVDIKQELAENISQYYMQKIYDLQNIDANISISIIRKSPLIYIVYIKHNIPFDQYKHHHYKCHVDSEIKIRMQNKLFVCDTDTIDTLRYSISNLSDLANDYKEQLNYYGELMKLPYIKSIHPKSHDVAKKKNIRDVPFVVEYEDYIHNQYICETIGVKEYYIFTYNIKTSQKKAKITENVILSDYKMFKKNAIQKLNVEIQSYALRNISDLNKFVNEVNNAGNYQLFYQKNKIISKIEYSTSSTLYNKEIVFELDDKTNLSMVYRTISNKIYYKYRKRQLLKTAMKKYMDIINQSKNGVWYISENWRWDYYNIAIVTSDGTGYETCFHIIEPYSKKSIEDQLCSIMNEMASGLYGGIRLLEVNNSIE